MQKIMIRKDVYDEYLKDKQDKELEKAGLPVGTIHGNYKTVSDNPSKWEFMTDEYMMKLTKSNDRRAYLANKAHLITTIKELNVNKQNYLNVGQSELVKMQAEAKNPQRKKMSRVKPDYNGIDMFHKSFDIDITEITENNKAQKMEQVEKALNAIYNKVPFGVKHIKADNSKRYNDVVLRITNFDKEKIQKAVHTMAFSLDTKIKSAKGEAFNYKAQEQLTDNIVSELTEKTKDVYSFLIAYFGLPEVRIISKANLEYKGKVLYDPESGKPIPKSEWDKFVKALEKYLNRNYTGIGKKIVLSGECLGRILERLSKTNSLEAIKNMNLNNMSYKGKSFDWISKDVKNMQSVFGESLDRFTQSRIQVAMDSAATRIAKVTDDMRNDIKQVIIDGIKNKQSKAKISQNLFDKCSGLNRDFQRIADTEIQNNANNAYLKEEVYKTPSDEKIYFRRFEQVDDNTCKKCKAINSKLALWSNVALTSEKIDDPYAEYAIWEGKTDGVMPVSIVHPYCRGGWYRYYPEADKK